MLVLSSPNLRSRKTPRKNFGEPPLRTTLRLSVGNEPWIMMVRKLLSFLGENKFPETYLTFREGQLPGFQKNLTWRPEMHIWLQEASFFIPKHPGEYLLRFGVCLVCFLGPKTLLRSCLDVSLHLSQDISRSQNLRHILSISPNSLSTVHPKIPKYQKDPKRWCFSNVYLLGTFWTCAILEISIILPETTQTLKISLPKRKVVFQSSIFRCYVTFMEGIYTHTHAHQFCCLGLPSTKKWLLRGMSLMTSHVSTTIF